MSRHAQHTLIVVTLRALAATLHDYDCRHMIALRAGFAPDADVTLRRCSLLATTFITAERRYLFHDGYYVSLLFIRHADAAFAT